MKSHFRRLIALVLVLCLVCPMSLSAQAAGMKDSRTSVSFRLNNLLRNIWSNMLEDLFDMGGEKEETQPAPETEPATEPSTEPATEPSTEPATEPSTEPATEPSTEPEAETEAPSVDASGDPGMDLALVEDQSTVSPKVMMRASVYEANENDPVALAELGDNNVIYYPITLIDYDLPSVTTGINKSMADLEVQYAIDNGLSTNSSDWVWKGLYFGEGGSTTGQNNREVSRTGSVITGDISYNQASNVRYSALASSDVTNSQTSYFYLENGKYYPVTVTRTSRTEGSWWNSTTYYTYTLYANGKQIWTSGETTSTNTTVSGVTLYTQVAETTDVTSSTYASWVKWGGNDTADQGPYIHSGITTGKLVNGVPQFVSPYTSRLFDNSEVAGKHVYTNVGLPLVLGEDGYYTFDSSYYGAYFPDGEAKSDVNLTLLDAPTVKQGYKQVNGQWKQAYNTCFMPFDEPAANAQSTTVTQTDGTERTTSAYRVSTGNYYFSMIASVPFTMTENGRENASDDTSEPIAFEFSGDDDVWVFVDDVLLLDLGGIHDAVSGKIDFANNNVTFWTCASGMVAGDATEGGYGTSDGTPISQGAIFNDGETVGKLNITRSTFAATDNHTMTIVYVERGANLSNNKIRFNLPQKDYIAVSKDIDENLYENTNETTVVGQITDALFETLNQRNFTYILYENGTAMVDKRFSRYDANGNFVGNGTTASDGTFNVKNGETVRFYDIEFDGTNSYYVAEQDPDTGSNNNAWGAATWAHNISTAYGDSATVIKTAKPDGYYVSDTITTQGSTEAVDVIYFTNTNKLLSPVADIANDEYVIDFGLPVMLNPLANDTYSATNDSLTLAGISDAADGTFGNSAVGKFGTLEIKDGKAVYTLTSQFTGVETFYYQVGLTSDANDLEGVYGTITIMPASTMYYEESFAGLNLKLTGTWTDVGTAQDGYQEEGRVGTTSDSPYGSDVLYMNNTGDSFGTSKYVNTTDGAATFSYTFTGTGTALYARTSDKSAYMIIRVKNADETLVEWRRNTIYKPVDETTELINNTLYNIPVYVYTAPEYGTYTVEVTLNRAQYDAYQDENGNWIEYKDKYSRGCDFYLDGIRVYNPANTYTDESQDSTKIEDAYRRDGEAYITVDSLRNKLLLDSTKYSYVLDENGERVLDEYGDPMIEIAWDGVNYVVFTDSDGTIEDAQTYQSAGPKEEVYLNAGQSVTFSLDNWDQNQNKVFLGIKAPAGSGSVSVNGEPIAINNTTDIYYDITKYAEVSGGVATFKITAQSALISVSTIKVTGTADFTIVSRGPAMPDGFEEIDELELLEEMEQVEQSELVEQTEQPAPVDGE